MTDSAAGVEMLDVVDDMGRHVTTKTREAVHLDGDWHRVFHCQIVAERDGVAMMVLQRRAAAKAAFPGLLDISAAGHLATGETPLEGIRELEEELGVNVDPSELVLLGERRLVDDSGEGRLNRELTSVFLLRDDRPLDAYVIEPSEVDAIVDVPVVELLAMLGGDVAEVTVDGVAAAGSAHAHPIRETIEIADLVPGSDYWITLMVMAQRLVAGQRPLAI